MRLESFRIFNYRSITDSGIVDLARITALLGRNESGKSNLLLALRTLNPVEGFAALNATKDFPRHRRLSECKPDTLVVSSLWGLTPDEQAELGKIIRRAASVTHVKIQRPYEKKRWVTFENLPPLVFNRPDIEAKVAAIAAAVNAASEQLEDDKKSVLAAASEQFNQSVIPVDDDMAKWAASASPVITSLTQAIGRRSR